MSELTLTQLAADPFVQTGVLAVVGALITRILLRHYPAQRLVFQSAFFLALTALLFEPSLKQVGMFVIYLAVLMFRPRGLFGTL